MLQDNIALDNYEEVLTSLIGAVSGAAINEQEQTARNLATVAAAFARFEALVNEMAIISNTVSFALNNQIFKNVTKYLSTTSFPSKTVQDLINTLESLQQWNEDVLQTNCSK